MNTNNNSTFFSLSLSLHYNINNRLSIISSFFFVSKLAKQVIFLLFLAVMDGQLDIVVSVVSGEHLIQFRQLFFSFLFSSNLSNSFE